ncbi:hypothetical protein PRIPAC_93206 [Pristionchus pacificus]|uniref:Uncharacterized protein n=1 Tax=Pristionchus pacificus TaxID=54126 RepID=A0A2A6CHY8_PRIPA|nr:hypothetical protein PRIPAC_93206 [Pristionchus pacificus]|eukprot:PDM77844.1 hypothetical protein PRIPAC_34711 [Pristionchus pacificus]
MTEDMEIVADALAQLDLAAQAPVRVVLYHKPEGRSYTEEEERDGDLALGLFIYLGYDTLDSIDIPVLVEVCCSRTIRIPDDWPTVVPRIVSYIEQALVKLFSEDDD